jgi:hypothetical protein
MMATQNQTFVDISLTAAAWLARNDLTFVVLRAAVASSQHSMRFTNGLHGIDSSVARPRQRT